MDEETFLELKQETLEDYEECIQDTLFYHEIQNPLDPSHPNPSNFNDRFGFVDAVDTPDNPNVPTTIATELFFSHSYKAGKKELLESSAEFVGDFDAKIFLSTQDLENKGVSISRERSFIRLKDGLEYQIEAVQPFPRLFGTSIVTKLLVSKKVPTEDNAGIN